MSEYFTTPFPFAGLIKKDRKIPKLTLQESIRTNLRSLILTRVGEFDYDKSMGFAIWDHDKQVFYHEREPYYENKNTKKGLMENANARKYFKENLKVLIDKNEIRLKTTNVFFGFEKVEGQMSVYQRKIVIKVDGKIKSTGKVLNPAFKMSILYTPFRVESN